jgi:SAM-dependent methyltransferase
VTGNVTKTSYDEVAYPGAPHPDARPSRLAAIAALFGFEVASPLRCRVLEIGGGDGACLIPLALEAPEATFYGFDLSQSAVERGQARIRELGLTNITLAQGDITTFEAAEPFDYIIAHGVFSWVPPDVQEQLLGLCTRLLAPHGLAYLTYATYPGCHQREMVRNLMLFHSARLPPEQDVVAESVAWARFVAQHSSGPESHVKAIEQELGRIQRDGLAYAFHDDFAEHNSPLYFGQLVHHARENGLEFFAEALFLYFDDPRQSPEVTSRVDQLSAGDPIIREQYLDFLRGRAFRQSLFCRADAAPPRQWRLDNMLGLYAAARLVPHAPTLAPSAVETEEFVSHAGVSLKADSPLVRAALRDLANCWPSAMSIAELLQRAEATLPPLPEAERVTQRELLLRTLLRAAAIKVVELDVAPPAFDAELSEKPRAGRLARLEAQLGLLVTNIWQHRVNLEDEPTRYLLSLLDGSRDQQTLARLMHKFFVSLKAPQTPTLDQVSAQLSAVLAGLRRRGLLY